MPHAKAIFARWLFAVSLALWLGGLLAIGAVVAPVTAHFLHLHPGVETDPLRKAAFLTAIVGGSLRVFNIVCAACGVLLLISQALLWRRTPRRIAIPSLAITVLLTASAFVLQLVLFPHMDAAQAAGQMNTFDLLHRSYEAVSTLFQLPLLLVLALLGAARDTAPESAAYPPSLLF